MGNFLESMMNKVKGKATETAKEAHLVEADSEEQATSKAKKVSIEPVMLDPKKTKHGGDVCCGSCGG